MRKTWKKVVAVLLASTMSAGMLTACGGKENGGGSSKGDSQTLKIYCFNAGYGTDWLTDMVEEFKKQDWVKEKYPNLVVEQPTVNDTRSFATSLLTSGANSNEYDLLFGMSKSYMNPSSGAMDLTDCLYNATVPGEDILYKDKMDAGTLQANTYKDPSGDDKESYYGSTWAGGSTSIIYNKTILDSFGIAEPNTTDEFLAACATIKANEGKNNGKYNKGASIIQGSDDPYWDYIFPTWWAQYDGIDGYTDFYNGIFNGRYSNGNFQREGRLEALKVFEKALDYNAGYLSTNSFSYQFMQAQTAFLQGEAVFHVNGDWFTREMSSTIQELNSKDEFSTMRMPVISALGTKLGITDAELSAILDYIDGDSDTQPSFTSTEGYTEEEVMERVLEARSINYSIGTAHTAIIPDYADAKNVAVDFLLFMATDIGLNCYTKGTEGSNLPFKYNVKESDADLYNSLNPIMKSVQDYFNNDKFTVYTLPGENAFPLCEYGGLSVKLNDSFFDLLAVPNKSTTAQEIFDEAADYWNTERFNNALSKAGIM